LKIQYINPNPPGAYRYYTDLENALRRTGCLVKDGGDVLVFGLSWFGSKRRVISNTNIPWVCILHKIGLDWEMKRGFSTQCELVLSSVPKLPIKHRLFKYGADPNIFYPQGKKIYDFGFSGALHDASLYPEGTFENENIRGEIQDLARTQTDLNLFLNGSDDIKPRIKSYEEYAEILSQSKSWLATTGPNGDIGPRYYEVMASGTLLFCDSPPQEYQQFFRNERNCVYITIGNFVDKLRYYLEHEEERNKIVETAYRDFVANHTWDKRAEELLEICSRLLRNAAL
jgi:hypothetical protein